MNAPQVPRRRFLGRMLAALAGGAWLEGVRRADAAPAGPYDMPFLGEIRMFAGDFEPWGWRFCDGRLLAIADYPDLFQLLGTTYGGDGQVEFGLPDLRGRAPVHVSTIQRGEVGGQETVALAPAQSPYHSHDMQASSTFGIASGPAARVSARNGVGAPHYHSTVDTYLATTTLTVNGGGQAHPNMMPSLGMNFIICIENGVVPPP